MSKNNNNNSILKFKKFNILLKMKINIMNYYIIKYIKIKNKMLKIIANEITCNFKNWFYPNTGINSYSSTYFSKNSL